MADEGAWDDSHRGFLQAVISRGTITFKDAQPLLAAIQSAHERRPIQVDDISEETFSAYISACQTAIAPFDYEIRSATHQLTRAKVYAFINASSDGLTQAATGFTADEIAFVKRVLDAIFETYNTKKREVCAITGTQALQLVKPRDGQGNTQVNGETQSGGGQHAAITMGNGEAVLKALVSQGWFDLSRKGFYSLSPRALMELRSWLTETYNDDDSDDDEESSRRSGKPIKFCQACKEIVTIGQRCSDKSCPIRLHEFCTDRFFRMNKSNKCPTCKKDWENHGLVGEKAAQVNGSRTSAGQVQLQRRNHNVDMDGAAENEPGESGDG